MTRTDWQSPNHGNLVGYRDYPDHQTPYRSKHHTEKPTALRRPNRRLEASHSHPQSEDHRAISGSLIPSNSLRRGCDPTPPSGYRAQTEHPDRRAKAGCRLVEIPKYQPKLVKTPGKLRSMTSKKRSQQTMLHCSFSLRINIQPYGYSKLLPPHRNASPLI